MKVKSLSRVLLSATPMDCSLPGSSIHGIFRQEYWSERSIDVVKKKTVQNSIRKMFPLLLFSSEVKRISLIAFLVLFVCIYIRSYMLICMCF